MADDASLAASARVIPAHVKPEQVFDYDYLNDPRIGEDVQGDLHKLLKQAPDIFWAPQNGGHWVIQRMEYSTEVARNWEFFSETVKSIPKIENEPKFIPLSLDPPECVPYRAVMMPFFSPKSVKEMEPKLRMWATRIIDDLGDAKECDFLYDVSSRYPVSIFMELMGMDVSKLRELRELADNFFKAHDQEGMTATATLIIAELTELIHHKQKNPGDDLTTHFTTCEMEGRKLTFDEVLAMVFILFLGGMDTVTNVTAFSYRLLAQRPDLQERLAADPTLIPKFIEEGLRCFAVVAPPRLVMKTHERYGVEFHEGDMLLIMLPNANRDDRVVSDPDAFSLDRAESPHVTFSSGPHLCLGHLLARAEMRILTEEWLKKYPRFSLVPNKPHPFRIGSVFAIDSLPFDLHPA